MKKRYAVLAALFVSVFLTACGKNVPLSSSVGKGASQAAVKTACSAPPANGKSGRQNKIWPMPEWKTDSPTNQGMDETTLSAADKYIKQKYPNITSFLVVRHGYIVYEKYYNGICKDTENPVYSVTKSVMSALTGIAIREKLIMDPSQKISDLLPEYFKNLDDVRKKDITIKNALTMTGGLKSIDDNYVSYFCSGDLIKYALDQPLTAKPGEKFEYNTALPHFISVIITKTSGMSTKEFANKYLFSKIGVKNINWQTDRKGYYVGGTELSLTSRDMARFGYLYLNGGSWDGQQIVPCEWVKTSTKEHAVTDENDRYGYGFWLSAIQGRKSGRSYPSFSATGAGGQKITVIPDLDLITVVTADVSQADKYGSDKACLAEKYAAPAINGF